MELGILQKICICENFKIYLIFPNYYSPIVFLNNVILFWLEIVPFPLKLESLCQTGNLYMYYVFIYCMYLFSMIKYLCTTLIFIDINYYTTIVEFKEVVSTENLQAIYS